MSPKISIVILQYNNSQDTLGCLGSVKELDYQEHEIIIVDNNSEAKHFNNVRFFVENEEKKFSAPLKLLASEFNGGYAAGNNIGVKYALEHGADYVLILNNDTRVEKNLLTKLVATCEKDKKIAVAGPMLEENGQKTYGGKISWLRPELEHLKSRINKFRDSRPHFFVDGSAMFIRRGTLEKIGLFDERYFLYFEDADYSMRILRSGYELKIISGTVVRHSSQASTSKLGVDRLLRYHYRNAHLFNSKNGPLWVKIALPFWSVFIIIKQLLKITFVPAKRKVAEAILTGVSDFYKNRFGKIND